MADQALVERLANLKLLKNVPRAELEWLVDHGRCEFWRAGTVFRPHDIPLPGLTILLSGSLAIHVERMGVQRRVMQWHAGDLTGTLPYSRMVNPPGDTVVHEDMEVFAVDKDQFRHITRECPEFTAICVHTMLDRARHFTGRDFQDEKMSSLGKMSAGLAHELNNPASAAGRSAKRLAEQKIECEDAARALFGARLNDEQLAALDEARAFCLLVPPSFLDTPLDRSDRVEAIAEWLEANGGEIDQATALAETAMNIDGLEKLARVMNGETLTDALRWLASTAAINSIAKELQESTRRISELVASVKGFTHMGQAAVAEPVNVGRGLSDTSRIMASKLRDKNVSLRLEIPSNLPPARAFGSELNQIWMNLIENALDAVPYGGEITIRAGVELDAVVVSVIDNGHGIPDDIKNRIFDPFFTTKAVGEGTGMGLDIVRRLVFNQKGEIEVESKPGRTEFKVAIPLASAAQGAPAMASAPSPVAAPVALT
jgi:signal transduction histidine kinase